MNKYYFQKDSERCYNLKYHYNYMKENNIKEMQVFLAKKEVNSPYFFCLHYYETGEKMEGGCGKVCDFYEPRNKKSGICKHTGYTYERTDKVKLLKL